MALVYIRPDADSIDGNWVNESASNVNLYDSLNESASPFDADYIRSENNPTNDICRLRLGNFGSVPTEPMTVRYRYKKVVSAAETLSFKVRLIQGGSPETIIAEWEHSDVDGAYVTQDQPLTTPQFESIVDFDDLYLEFEAISGALEVAPGALGLLTDETDGFAIDATTYDSITPAAYVGGPVGGTVATIDTGTPANDLSNVALDSSNLVQSGTSPKMVQWDSAPFLRWTPHNHLLRSQAWATSPWTTTGGVTATNNTGDVTDPLGGSTATKLVSTASADNYCLQTVTGLNGGATRQMSFSFWARTASGTATVGVLFDNESHSAEWTPVASTEASITSTWQRFTYSGSVTGVETICRVGFGGFSEWTTGDTIYVWGAQLNYGNAVLPHLVTTSAARIGIPQAYDPYEELFGILVEPAATNLIVRSADLTTTWGNESTSDTGNTDVAPDGSTSADTLTATAGAGVHNIFQVIGNLSTVHTISIYAKAGTGNYLCITWLNIDDDENHIAAVYDLANGLVTETDVGATSGTIVSTSINAVGNGWYRCAITGSGTNLDDVMIGLAGGATGNTFTSYGEITWTAAGETIKLWGAQMELGSIATSHIPTGSASATRAADDVSALTSTIPSFSSVSYYYRMKQFLHTTGNYEAHVSIDSSASNYITLFTNSTGGGALEYLARSAGSLEGNVGSIGNVPIDIATRLAARAAAASFNAGMDGIVATEDNTGTVPTSLTHVRIGNVSSTSFQNNMMLYYLVVLPRALDDTELG